MGYVFSNGYLAFWSVIPEFSAQGEKASPDRRQRLPSFRSIRRSGAYACVCLGHGEACFSYIFVDESLSFSTGTCNAFSKSVQGNQ